MKNILAAKINTAANGVKYITFEILFREGLKHGFSTCVGGVSPAIYQSMNLGFNRGDSFENVTANHRLFAEAVGYDYEKTVLSNQVHGVKIVHVTETDAGHGMNGEGGIKDADGLITDVCGLPIMTFYADCVPLFFYDPVKKVIAAAHSGWRGTVCGIGRIMVDTLVADNGCRREDILAVIGPSICKSCYEVSADVIEQFADVFPKHVIDIIVTKKEKGKYMLDLWGANEYILKDSGISNEHLETSGLCTYHNPELMISHRKTGGIRGSMAGVLVL